MWICKECETKNADGDRFCACCGAARPAAAAPETETGTSANAQEPRPRSGQTPPPSQGERVPPVREARTAAPRTPGADARRLAELNRQLTAETAPVTMQDNSIGFWIRKFFVSVIAAGFGGAFLTYAPLLILEDLWTKLFSYPLVTADQISVLGGPFILLCFSLYWVYIFNSKSRANKFAANWNGAELVFSVPPMKDRENLAIAVDGSWIAFGDCVPGGAWISRDGAVVGLHCACSRRPKTAVLALINRQTGNGGSTVYRANYIAVSDVS